MVPETLLYFDRNFERLVKQFEDLLKRDVPNSTPWKVRLKAAGTLALLLAVGYAVVLLLAALTFIIGWAVDSFAPGITGYLNDQPWWAETWHTFHVLFAWSPFFGPVLVALIKIQQFHQARTQKGEEALEAVAAFRTEIEEANERFPQMLKNSLTSVAGATPLREIVDALSPSNRDLQETIGRISDDTAQRMHLFSNILMLPPRARQSLKEITDLARVNIDDDHQHWKSLYISFAITLQMDPWKRAFGNESFVFVRDKEEVSCFFPADRVDIEFQNRLQQDLIEMLHLVNGKLYSVMYRDMLAWQRRPYHQQNADLLARKGGSDLKRLFVLEPEWMKPEQDGKANAYLVSAIVGAMWHSENKYRAKFLARNLADEFLFESGDHFLSSCLLNETVIKMSATAEPGAKGGIRKFDRYIYRCDSSVSSIESYDGAFQACWNFSEARSPKEFLEDAERDFPAAFAGAKNSYRVIGNARAASGDWE